jgi:hypothetical protein
MAITKVKNSRLTVHRGPRSDALVGLPVSSEWYRFHPHDATESGLFFGAQVDLRLKCRKGPDAPVHRSGPLVASSHNLTKEQARTAMEGLKMKEYAKFSHDGTQFSFGF